MPPSHLFRKTPFVADCREVRGRQEWVVVDRRTNRAELLCCSEREARSLAEQLNESPCKGEARILGERERDERNRRDAGRKALAP